MAQFLEFPIDSGNLLPSLLIATAGKRPQLRLVPGTPNLILSSLIYVPLSHIHTGCGLKNYLLVEAHEFLQKEVTQRKFLLPKQPFFHTPHRK
jgi:hypothetical protein